LFCLPRETHRQKEKKLTPVHLTLAKIRNRIGPFGWTP
jgi:hypothetical protein